MAPKGTILLRLAGMFCWLAVGVPNLLSRIDVAWLVAWLAFGAAFWFSSVEGSHQWPWELRIAGLIAQSAFAIAAVWLHPNPFMAVLTVIVAGSISRNVPLAIAFTWLAAQTIAVGFIFARSAPPGEYVPVTAAYFAFQVLAMFAVHLAQSETAARQELALANAELRSAADLLDASSRANERLRIARDLHDLLGHHLTALSVNLEVASHLTDGKAREHVEHAQSLAKLLLSDVRAVVSDLRDEQSIDVGSMLTRILEPVPQPKIELTVEPDLRIADPLLAQTLLRAAQEIVTNAMRHSGASTLRLDVRRDKKAVELRAQDDGRGVSPLRLGNGLTGIRERAEAAGGTAEYRSAPGAGFYVALKLPLAAERA